MKLCKSNVFANKILCRDEGRNLDFFSYEADVDIKRVLVTKQADITIQFFGDHVNITPFKFNSEEQFNNLAIQSILLSCKLNDNVSNSISFAKNHFNPELPLEYVLVSKNTALDKHTIKWIGVHVIDIIKVDGLMDNDVIFTPAPEYLGVVSVSGEDLDKYAIGIINSKGPFLVRT